MRIVFFTHYFPPEGNAPASRTYENCRRWVEAGHEVTVITGAPNVPAGVVYEGYQNRLWQREVLDGIDVLRVWTYIAPNKGTAKRIANYVSYMMTSMLAGLLVRRPDILISTSPQFFCGLAGMLVGRLRRVPRVLEIRDIWPESITAVGAMRRSAALRALEYLERFMYRSASLLVTVGKGYRGKLIERGVPARSIEVVTNGADLSLFEPGPADPGLRDRYGLGQRFAVAYVGTIGMASGLQVAIRAGQKLADQGDDSIRIVLVGDGAERAEIAAQARELSAVEVIGRLPKSEIPALLRSVDGCFIHLKGTPLFRTVLPSKMFEAFAMRRAVVLGVDGDAREIMERAEAGVFVRPDDEDDLIEKIRSLQADPAKCERLGDNGRKAAEQTFNRDTLAADYLQILERLHAS